MFKRAIIFSSVREHRKKEVYDKLLKNLGYHWVDFRSDPDASEKLNDLLKKGLGVAINNYNRSADERAPYVEILHKNDYRVVVYMIDYGLENTQTEEDKEDLRIANLSPGNPMTVPSDTEGIDETVVVTLTDEGMHLKHYNHKVIIRARSAESISPTQPTKESKKKKHPKQSFWKRCANKLRHLLTGS